MSIITRGFVEGNIVSKGYGSTLVIIIDDNVPVLKRGGGAPVGAYPPPIGLFSIGEYIRTRRIVVRYKKKEVYVNAILINSTDLEEVKATISELGFTKTEVYLRGEVELLE